MMDAGFFFAQPLPELKEGAVTGAGNVNSSQGKVSNTAVTKKFQVAAKETSAAKDSPAKEKVLETPDELTSMLASSYLFLEPEQVLEEELVGSAKLIDNKLQSLFEKAQQFKQELAINLEESEAEPEQPLPAEKAGQILTQNLSELPESEVAAKLANLLGDKLAYSSEAEPLAASLLQEKAIEQFSKAEEEEEEPDPEVEEPQPRDKVKSPRELLNNLETAKTQLLKSNLDVSFEVKNLLGGDADSKTHTSQTTNLGLNSFVENKELAWQKIQAPEQPVQFDDVQELVDKMVEQARLTQKPGSSEMVIRLKPENLGELTVRIIAENGGAITAAFHSNNSEVRGILQEALPALRQELSNTGLKVQEVGVYAGLSDFQSFANGDHGNREAERLEKIAALNKLSKEEQELLEELQLAKRGENQSSDGGIDYLV